MRFLPFLILCLPALAQTPQMSCSTDLCGPYSSATNFTVDILGTPDTRPATWGTAGVQTWKVAFHPPAGYRVRVLRVYGDLIAMAHAPRVQTSSLSGAAGVLWGLQSTAAPNQGDSALVDYSGDGTFLYVQGALTPSTPLNRAVDYDVSAGGLLAADNILVVKVAAYLNDTGLPIHMEPTWTMSYRFERSPLLGLGDESRKIK